MTLGIPMARITGTYPHVIQLMALVQCSAHEPLVAYPAHMVEIVLVIPQDMFPEPAAGAKLDSAS